MYVLIRYSPSKGRVSSKDSLLVQERESNIISLSTRERLEDKDLKRESNETS